MAPVTAVDVIAGARASSSRTTTGTLRGEAPAPLTDSVAVSSVRSASCAAATVTSWGTM